MSELNRPAGLSTIVEALDRRIRALEVAARDGLGHTRITWGTAAVDPVTFGAWESGAPGTTWIDDQGNTGTGYAQLTARTGRRALVVFCARVINMSSNTSFRTSTALVGIGVNALLPDQLAGLTGQRSLFTGDNSTMDQNVAFTFVRTDLTPGPNVFRAYARWQDNQPAAPFAPRLTDAVIAVLPLDPPS